MLGRRAMLESMWLSGLSTQHHITLMRACGWSTVPQLVLIVLAGYKYIHDVHYFADKVRKQRVLEQAI
jgi:hypothetical protein